ncbi:MAG TPA: hypothetical protein VF860_09220 [Candidatus Acidoferrales bacterium]
MPSDKAALVGRVLEQLAEGHYDLSKDELGEIVLVKNYCVTFDEMEEFFGEELGELEEIRDDIEEKAPDDPLARGLLSDHWNDWWTEQFFIRLYGDQEGKKLARIVAGLGYGAIISSSYELLTKGIQEMATPIVLAREALTKRSLEELEATLLTNSQAGLRNEVASEYARVFGMAFVDMIDRAEALRTLPAVLEVPEDVQQYLLEATRSYVVGLFSACLIICRSSLEFGLRDFLTREARQRGDESLRPQQRDSLWSLIGTARSTRPDLRATWDGADSIRLSGRDAVHTGVPSPEVCREAFEKTRGILRELYT